MARKITLTLLNQDDAKTVGWSLRNTNLVDSYAI